MIELQEKEIAIVNGGLNLYGDMLDQYLLSDYGIETQFGTIESCISRFATWNKFTSSSIDRLKQYKNNTVQLRNAFTATIDSLFNYLSGKIAGN